MPADERGSRDRLGSLLGQAKQLQGSLKSSGTAAATSYTLIGAIVLLGGIGYLCDRWLGTDPWLLLVGLLAGIVVGFYELARALWR